MGVADLFVVPLRDKLLVYAPLHHLAALVNRRALDDIYAGLQTGEIVNPAIRTLLKPLLAQEIAPPATRHGPLKNPIFLGIIPTRGCNMACHYCDFAAPKQTSPAMDLALARRAVDAYFALIQPGNQAQIQFFGGEPFFAEQVVHFVVEYARNRAAERQITVRFEATSNGLYNTNRCRWIADHFDTIVLSLDGQADVQNRHRPGFNGHSVADIIIRNARILSDGPVELVIRACVTDQTVRQMPEFARWVSREFRPSMVCFESLSLSHTAEVVHFAPPDPWEFATYFDQAARILAEFGIQTVLSTADLRQPRLSFCPVGSDALIVSGDGAVDSCYLLKKDWERAGLDMRLGWLSGDTFDLSPEAIERVRGMTVDARLLCANCFCRYSCAGGCHVNHTTSTQPGEYDPLCIQTRIITITTLLRQLGQNQLADAWLADRPAVQTAVWQTNDRLIVHEGVL